MRRLCHMCASHHSYSCIYMRQLRSASSSFFERTARVPVRSASCARAQPFAAGRGDTYAGATRAALTHPRHHLHPRRSAASLNRKPCQTPHRRVALLPLLPGASFRLPPPRVLVSMVIARRLSTQCARRISPRSSSRSRQSTSSISCTPRFTANGSGRSGLSGAIRQRATRCGKPVFRRRLGAKPLWAACIAATLFVCAAHFVPMSSRRIQHAQRAHCSSWRWGIMDASQSALNAGSGRWSPGKASVRTQTVRT